MSSSVRSSVGCVAVDVVDKPIAEFGTPVVVPVAPNIPVAAVAPVAPGGGGIRVAMAEMNGVELGETGRPERAEFDVEADDAEGERGEARPALGEDKLEVERADGRARLVEPARGNEYSSLDCC